MVTAAGGMYLSLITDEISRDPVEACLFAQEIGVAHVAIRGIDGVHAVSLSDGRLREVNTNVNESGLCVSSVLSPYLKAYPPGVLGQRLIDPHIAAFSDDPAHHLGLESRLVTIADIFSCQVVRVFSYLRSRPEEDSPPIVIQTLKDLGQHPRGEIFSIENEHVCYVATVSELRDTCVATGLRAILDVANHWRLLGNNGAHLLDEEFCHQICDVHVKDMSLDGRFVPSGDGAVGWREVLYRLASLGYRGPVTLEAHLGNDLDGIRRSCEWLASTIHGP
jgi:sugar phosphate isomerase/epimerase